MIWIDIVKNLLVSVYQKIGAMGCILIIALAFIFSQHLEIKRDVNTIGDLTAQKAQLKSDIEAQNAAIDEVAKTRDAVIEAAANAANENIQIESTVGAYEKKIDVAPESNTCPTSVAELATVGAKVATTWNKRSLK
jgi:hypothetical protein